MNSLLLSELECAFKKCSDCSLHYEYVPLLEQLKTVTLTQDLVDYLCDKITSKKHFWEIRFDHLRVLLLNPTSKDFDLKNFYFERSKRSRRLAIKIFFIRGYAIYATEEELTPMMEKFCKSLEKNHDYIDYEYVLSVAGLPYLAEKYGYDCFIHALKKAKEEYQHIDPLLRGYFTLNRELEQIQLLSYKDIVRRGNLFLEKIRNKH